MIRKSNWHDRWFDRWKAAHGEGRPVPKLRKKDPRLPPDVFSEPVTLADAAGIIEATKSKPVPGYTANILRDRLNVAAIYWAAESRSAAKIKGRGNSERTRFLNETLGEIFEEAFGRRAAVNMTKRSKPTSQLNYVDGGTTSRPDSPFARFALQTLVALDYPTSANALYDLSRGKKPTKKKPIKHR